MRLAKFLALSGVASRRRSEEIIRQGRVQINGLTVERPQTLVKADDAVFLDGRLIGGFQKKRYVLLNKPAGYISTACDTHGRPTVLSLVKNAGVRLYPVGRLDADTTGVLLLTNDGELAYRLTHPRYGVNKVYSARVRGVPAPEALQRISRGVVVDGEKTAPALIDLVEAERDKSSALVEITLREGRKRQVKKMLEAIGHPVITLSRLSFAGLGCADLPLGSYRFLGEEELNLLFKMTGLA